MSDDVGIAPAVESILSAARDRSGADRRLSVDARSLPAAFESAESAGRVPVIAEVKPTSPTTEGERTDDPVELARGMVAGGAAALSVLTEPEHFGGSPATLERVREAVDVPVLRKDFILHEDQLDVVEADVILLIVRFLREDNTDGLAHLIDAARERGFQVLVEAHSEDEIDDALEAGASILGVNNRDLAKLEVDLGTFERVSNDVPGNVTLIAESGISTRTDVERMRINGADGLLVGSAIMNGDVTENTNELTTMERQTETST